MPYIAVKEEADMRVGLVQINNAFSGQHYFPYTVGVLQSYAEANLPNRGHYEFLPPIFRRMPVQDAVAELAGVDVAAFSVYCWSEQLSLAIAQALKRVSPSTLIVFGGPQVPRQDRPWEVEDFHKRHRFVDIAVHGPGEMPFAAVLEQAHSRSWDEIPSASFLTPEGALYQTPQAPELRNLALVPEPYLTGRFDELMERHPATRWIGIDETNRNCPFQCTFCGWGLLASKPIQRPLEEVYRVIDWFAERKIEYIFYCDANFGIFERDVEIARYLATMKRQTGFPKAVSVQDGKNVEARVHEVRMRLIEGGIDTPVVMALQSVHAPTLQAIKRKNISTESYLRNQQRFAAKGLKTMTDLILALPEETYDSWAQGVAEVVSRGQHNRIQFNNLAIVPDAGMSHRDSIQQFGIETVRTKIMNMHGRIEHEEIAEYQNLVIATAAMPREDWIRARAFAWMTGLLYFDKLLQIPFILAHEVAGTGYRELFELFSGSHFDPVDFPIFHRIRSFFEATARGIQAGGVEYCYARAWLDINWPADEYIFIELATSEKLATFYEEAERLLSRVSTLDAGLLRDAIGLNRALLKLPFQDQDLELALDANVWDVYRAVLTGETVPLARGSLRYRIDRTSQQWHAWDEWFEKVIWWCNRSGAYLYGLSPIGHPVAGHY